MHQVQPERKPADREQEHPAAQDHRDHLRGRRTRPELQHLKAALLQAPAELLPATGEEEPKYEGRE